MNSFMLYDLDELVLSVREPESKRLISEAVDAYRGNALRSAVVATWIAVAYDIIAKIRELAGHGEDKAANYISELDSAISKNDLKKLQNLENKMLENAQGIFELFSSHEMDDLKRIYKDRNKCAHPALVSEDVLVTPTPEQVRAHITHAIIHLLRHPPVQGKSALLRLERDILSESFPDDPQKIEEVMKEKHLQRTRGSVVAQMAKGLFSTLIGSEREKYRGKESQIAHAFAAIGRIKSEIFDEAIPSFVKKRARDADDAQSVEMFVFIGAKPEMWDWFQSVTKTKFREIIKKTNITTLLDHAVFTALCVDDLLATFLKRINDLEPGEQATIIAENPNIQFVEKVIELYEASGSFRSAEWNGEYLVLPHAQYLNLGHLEEIINAAIDNGQILHAMKSSRVLTKLFNSTQRLLPKSKPFWKKLYHALTENNLLTSYTYGELADAMKKHSVINRKT